MQSEQFKITHDYLFGYVYDAYPEFTKKFSKTIPITFLSNEAKGYEYIYEVVTTTEFLIYVETLLKSRFPFIKSILLTKSEKSYPTKDDWECIFYLVVTTF